MVLSRAQLRRWLCLCPGADADREYGEQHGSNASGGPSQAGAQVPRSDEHPPTFKGALPCISDLAPEPSLSEQSASVDQHLERHSGYGGTSGYQPSLPAIPAQVSACLHSHPAAYNHHQCRSSSKVDTLHEDPHGVIGIESPCESHGGTSLTRPSTDVGCHHAQLAQRRPSTAHTATPHDHDSDNSCSRSDDFEIDVPSRYTQPFLSAAARAGLVSSSAPDGGSPNPSRTPASQAIQEAQRAAAAVASNYHVASGSCNGPCGGPSGPHAAGSSVFGAVSDGTAQWTPGFDAARGPVPQRPSGSFGIYSGLVASRRQAMHPPSRHGLPHTHTHTHHTYSHTSSHTHVHSHHSLSHNLRPMHAPGSKVGPGPGSSSSGVALGGVPGAAQAPMSRQLTYPHAQPLQQRAAQAPLHPRLGPALQQGPLAWTAPPVRHASQDGAAGAAPYPRALAAPEAQLLGRAGREAPAAGGSQQQAPSDGGSSQGLSLASLADADGAGAAWPGTGAITGAGSGAGPRVAPRLLGTLHAGSCSPTARGSLDAGSCTGEGSRVGCSSGGSGVGRASSSCGMTGAAERAEGAGAVGETAPGARPGGCQGVSGGGGCGERGGGGEEAEAEAEADVLGNGRQFQSRSTYCGRSWARDGLHPLHDKPPGQTSNSFDVRRSFDSHRSSAGAPAPAPAVAAPSSAGVGPNGGYGALATSSCSLQLQERQRELVQLRLRVQADRLARAQVDRLARVEVDRLALQQRASHDSALGLGLRSGQGWWADRGGVNRGGGPCLGPPVIGKPGAPPAQSSGGPATAPSHHHPPIQAPGPFGGAAALPCSAHPHPRPHPRTQPHQYAPSHSSSQSHNHHHPSAAAAAAGSSGGNPSVGSRWLPREQAPSASPREQLASPTSSSRSISHLLLEGCKEQEEERDQREAMLAYLHNLTTASKRRSSTTTFDHDCHLSSGSPLAAQAASCTVTRSILGRDDDAGDWGGGGPGQTRLRLGRGGGGARGGLMSSGGSMGWGPSAGLAGQGFVGADVPGSPTRSGDVVPAPAPGFGVSEPLPRFRLGPGAGGRATPLPPPELPVVAATAERSQSVSWAQRANSHPHLW